jgi:hypothetical protein
MTDLIVDLDHLTAVRGLLAGSRARVRAALDALGAGAPGAAELDDAWAGFRQRGRADLGRLVAALDRVDAGLAACAAAYAAVEAGVARSLG